MAVWKAKQANSAVTTWYPSRWLGILADLNAKLFADCRHDENRMVVSRTQSVDMLLLT